VWQRRSSTQQGDKVLCHGPRGSIGAHLSKEVRSGAVGHVMTPKPTFAGMCGPKLQLMWHRVDTHSPPYLDLKLVYEGIRSSGCRHMRCSNVWCTK
jgi:hypothetical protein